MPELPEVEHARRNLSRWLRGRTIASVEIADLRVVQGGAKARLSKALTGQKVTGVERRGKWLRIDLSPGPNLYGHLGMTGKWVSRDADAPAERFEKVRIVLTKGKRCTSVRYIDPRVLGRVRTSAEEPPFWRKLGPDPLIEGIDPKRLATMLAKRKRSSIKEALMDQAILAGVGNILATEALFLAKVHPTTPASSLGTAQVRALTRAVDEAIQRSLSSMPDDEITYVSENRKSNPFLIYGRAGKPCPRCKTTLARIVLGGRGTVFCPKCQARRAR